jgi:hypothetical protein
MLIMGLIGICGKIHGFLGAAGYLLKNVKKK